MMSKVIYWQNPASFATKNNNEKQEVFMTEIYKNYDELPAMLSVPQLANFMGISRAGAYELVRQKTFPSMKIGTRIVIPKDKLLLWIDEKISNKE